MNAADRFLSTIGPPDVEVPIGIEFSDDADQLIWQRMYDKTRAGWFKNRFLFLFGEGLDALMPCVEAWAFLLPDDVNPTIVGRNVYGAIAIIEQDNGLARLGIIDPLAVTYYTDGDALWLGSFVGTYLPNNEIPRFLDDSVYRAHLAETPLYLELDLCLAMKYPLSVGGTMTLDNFQVEGIVDYYETTAEIYRKALNLPKKALPSKKGSELPPVPELEIDPKMLARVRDALRGVGALGGGYPSDNAPVDAVFRAYEDIGAAVSKAVAACLRDSDSEVRAQALLFFRHRPDAPGAEQLTRIWNEYSDLYVEIPNPWIKGEDLAQGLLFAIGGRVAEGDPHAIQLAKREVLVPSRGHAVIAALTRREPRWVIKRAAEIVAATPATGALILRFLSGSDAAAIAAKIVPLAASDPDFRKHIEWFIDDPGLKARILAFIA